MGFCKLCGNIALHEEWLTTGKSLYCCTCFVGVMGRSPTDWHHACMEAYKNLKEKL